jgi:hypothetical protein
MAGDFRAAADPWKVAGFVVSGGITDRGIERSA